MVERFTDSKRHPRPRPPRQARSGRAVSARDVIARAMPQLGGNMLKDADDILAALTAAGYRILAPGDLDPVTIERCAAVCDAFAESEQNEALVGVAASTGVGSQGWRKDAMSSHACELAGKIATALRSLEKQNG